MSETRKKINYMVACVNEFVELFSPRLRGLRFGELFDMIMSKKFPKGDFT